jgi:phage gp16-like protein
MTQRSMQKLIHVACRELKISSETRRDIQVVVTGKDSMSDMTDVELKKMLDHLKAKGFKVALQPGHRKAAPRSDLRYIHVLWRLLGEADVLKQPDRAGLNAFVRSRFEDHWSSVPIDIDALQNAAQINDVTRALKDWCKREGIRTER